MSKLEIPNSLWRATATKAAPTKSLQGEKYVDVAIVGAGFNGLRAAIVLAEAGKTVAVVDSGDIGWGASGRNGGQVNPIGHETPAAIARRWENVYDNQYAKRFPTLVINAADELFDVVRKHQIKCDAEQNGWIRAVHGKSSIRDFETMYEGWSATGADLRKIDHKELERLSGTSGYKMGWVAPRGGSVQPMSYVRGLAKAAQTAGATIYTHSQITSLVSKNSQWLLSSDKGKISADQVLLCTNGYTDQLFPGLQQSIVPVVSIQAATEPLSKSQNQKILPQKHTFADTRRVIYYFKKTADNRLVFGSAGFSGDHPGAPDKQRILKGLTTVYPFLTDIKLDYIWGGRIAVTEDHLPHIHQPAPGLWAGLGCNGRGVAMSTVMGRLLAELALGKDPKDCPIPVSKIKKYPFHRFHRAGIKIALHWKEYQDKKETKE